MTHKNFVWHILTLGLMLCLIGPMMATPATAQTEDFTIVVLPDTQYYSQSYPDIFTAQTQWIVENKDSLNIAYVAHEGDLVNWADEITQWDRADAAMSLLEDPISTGLTDGIPYGVVPGNHDWYGSDTNYNVYFGPSRFDGRGYYGGHYDTGNENNYTLFSAGGMDFIVVNLNYDPDSNELAWANARLAEFSSHRAIVVSHSMLNTNGSFTSAGQNIYDALRGNANLFLMLCGHMHGEARRTETYNGNTVEILLADYQDLSNGGNGWLRTMEFSPANNEITVTTYSPTLDEYGQDTSTGDDTTSAPFTLSYNMGGSGSSQSLLIEVGDDWRYFKGTEEPPSGWNAIGFDDSSWSEGPTGIGYADDDDATVLTDMEDGYISLYIRNAFIVDDPSAVSGLELSMDYDDGFVAYLNGTEIARGNVSGTPPAYDTAADDNHEASSGDSGASEVEYFSVDPSLLVTGANVLAIQGHNRTIDSSDFSLIPALTATLPPPENWIAYNDLNNEGGGNAANVTEHDYAASDALLKDYDTGVDLSVSMTVNSSGGDTFTDGGNFTTTSSDAYLAFDNIVNLTGVYQLDDVSDYSTINFDGLDPTKEYIITLTANRDNLDYAGMRYTKVTIEGADTYANGSSTGVIINSEDSVSFGIGYNTENGYVAKWTGVTAADGGFSIKSEWDDTLGTGTSNSKGYAMSAFKLEQGGTATTEPPDAPTDLTATAASSTQIDLGWTDNADNETGFEIERSTGGSGGPFSLLDTVPANTTSYPDTGLDAESEYCYRVRATNNVGESAYTDVECATTPAAPSTVTIEVWVNQDSDDAEERDSDGAMDLTSSDLELVHDSQDDTGVDQLVGMRFQNIEVPAGATIESAYIEFETDETDNISPSALTLYGQADDNPTTFTSSVNDISGRPQTSASVAWTPGVWDTVSEKHQTSDLSTIVQEIVNRGGWLSGNAMVFMVEGSGQRIAESYDGEQDNAPLLVIEYSEEATTDPPAAPTGLSATAASSTQIDLGWTDNADNETGFEIERSTTGSGGTFTLLGTVSANVVSYVDMDLTAESEYCYRVHATNSMGESAYTDVACATTQAAPTTVSFQQDVGGYTGTVDTYLDINNPTDDNSGETPLVVDGPSDDQHILLRFEDIFGTGIGQIPSGSIIQSASLEINVTNESDTGASLHRMLQTWNDTDNWDTWPDGIDADGTEAETTADSSSNGSDTGSYTIDVTSDLQAWISSSTNYGWAWLPLGENSWRFDSAEGGTPPKLTVMYTPPTGPIYTLTVTNDGNGSVTLDPPSGLYNEGTIVTLTPAPNSGHIFDSWGGVDVGDLTDNGNGTWSITMDEDKEVSATFALSDLAAGDIIISGFQSSNSPGDQNPGEFIELFNTTDEAISLETMALIVRLDGAVDWELSADLTGQSIAAHSFFLIAESDVSAPSSLHDIETDIDLTTNEAGVGENTIGIELLVESVHMDYVLYGCNDGCTGADPDGDLGTTWPRAEVIRATGSSTTFSEGLVRRETAADLYAGYNVEGYYTDEDALGNGYPNGVWTSPHDEEEDGYEARNSASPAVLPPVPVPPDEPLLVAPEDGSDDVAISPDPTLEVTVFDPNGSSLEVTFYGRTGIGSFEILETVSDVVSGENAAITWPDLLSDTEYEWYVEVSDGSLTTTGSTWSFTTALPIPPPAAPTGLEATVISDSQIDLSWTDNADNETGFEVWSADTVGNPITQLETVGTNNPNYSNTGLDPETEYCYVVRATNSGGDSDYSNVVCATTATAPTTRTFQQGINGYNGTQDTFLQEGSPDNVNGAEVWWEWDDSDPNDTDNQNFGLIRFDSIFGADPGQIPLGSNIISATLTYVVGGDNDPQGVTGQLHEVNITWDASSANWNNFGSDPGLQGDYNLTSVTEVPADSADTYDANVTSSLLAWVNDPGNNMGWIVVPPPPGETGGGVNVRSSEYSVISERPMLTVLYTPPTDPVYILTMAIDPTEGGTTDPAIGGHAYPEDTNLDITATPNIGYEFDHWSGNCTGSGSCPVTMDENKSVTAHFTIYTFTLDYAAGTGGTLTGDASQVVDYGNDGTVVTAVPNTGYHFVQWSDGSTDNPRTDTYVTANVDVSATFATYTNILVVSTVGNGAVSSDPAGINCGMICSAYFNYNTMVTLTATPNAGSAFTGWSGACSGTDDECVVTMDAIKTVRANFAGDTFTLDYAAGTGGTLTGDASQVVDYGNDGTAVTAVPNTGYHFVQWSDGSTDNPRTDTYVTANVDVSAIFIGAFTLDYAAGTGGTLTGDASQVVDYGNDGTAVTAVPNTGYHFVQWSDGSTDNPRTDTYVTANVDVSANFAVDTFTLDYDAAAGANGSLTGVTSQEVDYGDDGTPVTAVPFTGYHFVDWSDGSTDNPRTDTYVTANVDVSAIFIQDNPAIEITGVANVTEASVGEVITYTYSVQNTGNVEITSIQASDDRLGIIKLGEPMLLPSEVTTGMFTYTVTMTNLPGPMTNTVTVTALAGSYQVNDSDIITVQLKPGSGPSNTVIYLPIITKNASTQ